MWYDFNRRNRRGNAHQDTFPFLTDWYLPVIDVTSLINHLKREHYQGRLRSIEDVCLQFPHLLYFSKSLKIPTFILTIFIGLNFIFRLEDWYIQPTDSRHSRWDSCPSTKLTFSLMSFFLCSLCLLVRSAMSGVSPPAWPRHTGVEATGQLPCCQLVRSDIWLSQLSLEEELQHIFIGKKLPRPTFYGLFR